MDSEIYRAGNKIAYNRRYRMVAQPDRATVTWSTPECPFSIECGSRVLDDIRLAVNDAFFSLPRGGAEIGGILMGNIEDGRLTISGCAALDCEHALGPSFTLSLGDETKLQELIRVASAAGAGRVVGWYHSHTRSGVLLSDTDLTIHNRFFPEPWQVALVVKPHAFEPMRGGFFFRGPGGIIHCSASYREFTIEPVPMQQVPRAVAADQAAQPAQRTASAGPIVDVRAEPEVPAATAAPIVDVQAEPEAPPPAPAPPAPEIRAEPASESAPEATTVPETAMPEAAPKAEPAASEIPIPRMFEQAPERPRAWPKLVLVAGLVVVAGVAAYATRGVWYRAAASPVHQAPPPARAESIGLNTMDEAGQLQIRWDPNSAPVRSAFIASLEIVDGDAAPSVVALDTRHLASGVFTYGRRSERVDVTLALDQPNGTKVRQVTSFLGQKPPAPVAPAPAAPLANAAQQDLAQKELAQAKKDREEMSRKAAGLRAQLDAEIERSRKLEKQLAAARAQLREQQLRRLGNQAAPLDR